MSSNIKIDKDKTSFQKIIYYLAVLLATMALKPTTCKDAIARWEKEKGETAAEAKVIELQFQWPPIEKMDGALSTLVNCE